MAASQFRVANGLKVVGTTTLTTLAAGTSGTPVSGGKILQLDSSGNIIYRTNSEVTSDLSLGDIEGVTAGDGLSGGGTSGTVTVSLTEPGTLTASTGNAEAGNHTHAITASDNPGAAVSLLKTSAAGKLTVQVLEAAATTDSTGSSTGAIITGGGMGVAKTATFGEDVVITGNLTVQGTQTVVSTTNTLIEDKAITVNDGGTTAAAVSAGIEIEGDSGTVVGYFRTGASDNGLLDLKAPTGNILTLDVNADKTMTVAGALNIEADSIINQDLSSDSTAAQFATLTVTTSLLPDATGGADIGSTGAEFGDIFIGDGKAFKMGADQDVTLTHVADAGVMLNADMAMRFRDATLEIKSSADGQLDIDADTTLQITAPTVDIDASTEVNISNDLVLSSDSSILAFGADEATTLTHVNGSGVVLGGGEDKLGFTQTDFAEAIFSSSDGQLDVVAGTEVQIVSPTIDINASTGLALDGANLASDWTVNTDKKILFRYAAIYLNSSADGQLDIDADTEVEITTTTVDLNGILDVSGNFVHAETTTKVGTTAAITDGSTSYIFEEAVASFISAEVHGSVVDASGNRANFKAVVSYDGSATGGDEVTVYSLLGSDTLIGNLTFSSSRTGNDQSDANNGTHLAFKIANGDGENIKVRHQRTLVHTFTA